MRLDNTGKQVVTGDWSSCDTKLFENIRKLCCEEFEPNFRENARKWRKLFPNTRLIRLYGKDCLFSRS